MSGPIAIEYVIVNALLQAAWRTYQASQERRAEEARQQQAIAQAREDARRTAVIRREEERRQREEARKRADHAAALMVDARAQEQRLERARNLAAEARSRFAEVAIDIPAMPAGPADRDDPEAVERYIATVQGAVRLLDERMREQATRAATKQGLQELMNALGDAVDATPRTAGELLASYANEVRVLARPAAAKVMDRQATAQRILGRLQELAAGALPSTLEALMRKLIEADSEQRAELLALELRAEVQRLNEAQARAAAERAENQQREIAGILVAEVLSDLGYEVEPIAETLFVAGGVAHFQRAEWGDYYVRMRVDPATSNINFNMVRTSTSTDPPDAAQLKRDEAMEATWCTGIPKLLAELRARGIATTTMRELDAGAVPVQLVKPETIDAVLREKGDARITTAPRQMARPLK